MMMMDPEASDGSCALRIARNFEYGMIGHSSGYKRGCLPDCEALNILFQLIVLFSFNHLRPGYLSSP